MKNMLNFEKISHLYLQQKVVGFTKIMQGCLEKLHLLKDGELNHNVDEYCLIDNGYNHFPLMNFIEYKDFRYIIDGYCFSFKIDCFLDVVGSRIMVKKDNRQNGIYVYLNEELKEVLMI